jgi:sigma-B regulation protein RsbU (phosphoserine phosphatase)
MPPLHFLSTEDSARIAIFSQVMRAVRDGMDMEEGYRTFVGMIRRAFPTFCYVEASTSGLKFGQYRITRIAREDGSEAVPDRSPWRIAGVPIQTGGVIAEILARNASCVVPDVSMARSDPVFAELGEYRTIAATPGGLGQSDNWVLVLSRKAGEFDLPYLENLSSRTGMIGATLRSLQTAHELRKANAFIDAEVDQIAKIQRALLPAESPDVPGLDISACSATFDRAGGDFYDYAHLPNDRWAVIIADASGHGPAAAVVAAMLNAILHAYGAGREKKGSIPAPGEVLDFANAQLAAKQIEQSFVTAFLGAWDPATRTFTYARAGHNPPFLLKSSGEIISLDAVGSLPLAILPETTYCQHVQPLDPGDILTLYTDGIVEAFNDSHEPFGEDRLRQAMRSAKGTAAEILATLRQAVQTHTGDRRPTDDQTLVVLRVR